jgi:hypothetical protein
MRVSRPLAALLAAPVLTLLTLAMPPAAMMPAASPAPWSAAATQKSHGVEPEQGPIDTTNREAVRDAYRRMWVRGDESRPRWIGGSVEGCRPGHLAATSTRRQLDAINFARSLAGLQEVALDATSVPSAQAAALMMTAEHAVSHYPSRDWKCWTRAGSTAAGQSLLYEGLTRESDSDKIEAYLDDWGRPNFRAGHRRWLLYPHLTAVGIAGTSRANVTTVFGAPLDATAPNPAWVSWPTAGWFPSLLDPRGRWSLSAGSDDTDFTAATVTVTWEGQAVAGIKLRAVDDGAGKPTLVWEMPHSWPGRPVGRADVTVSDVLVDGTPTQAAYTIRFFRTR